MISRKLEQLKTDNARLLHLLAKTREYQNFVEYVDENRGIARYRSDKAAMADLDIRANCFDYDHLQSSVFL